MRNLIDFTSWQGALSTLLGLVLVTFVAVGIRLVVMQRVQQRRERQNRQINERLKVLIAAYKTLGGSFTGNLVVDPTHLKEQRLRTAAPEPAAGDGDSGASASERRRRIRDAVEAALSDVILLGTGEQVRLAVAAANDMVAGRAIETAALVTSLRNFIREALDLEALPSDLSVPKQGPLRNVGAPGGGRGGAGAAGGGRGGGGGGAGAGAGGGGAGLAAGGALGVGAHAIPTAEGSTATAPEWPANPLAEDSADPTRP